MGLSIKMKLKMSKMGIFTLMVHLLSYIIDYLNMCMRDFMHPYLRGRRDKQTHKASLYN